MLRCRGVVVAAVTLIMPLAAAGCGEGSGRPTPTAFGARGTVSTSESPISSADFCKNLDDLNSTAQAVGLDKSLGDVRSDLAKSAAKASAVLDEGVPKGSSVGPIVVRLAGDLATMSSWARSRATQVQIDSDGIPSSVRRALNDMGFDFRYLQQWSGANCKSQQQGDGR